MDPLPIWAIYILTVLFTLLAMELGYWLGKAWRRRVPEEKESAVGALAGATLGLLAFMLAFTTGMAISRFDNRRQLVLSEANVISTWFALYGVTFLSMLLVGMQSSYGPRQNVLALVVLVLAFAAVMLLVVDLDRAQEGALTVNQQAMLDLQRQLHMQAQ